MKRMFGTKTSERPFNEGSNTGALNNEQFHEYARSFRGA
jgi:hypothetical protein